MILHLTQVERRFRRINAKLRKLFNVYRLVVKEDNPNELRSHIMIINEINNLIQLMIIDTVIHLAPVGAQASWKRPIVAPTTLKA